MVADTVAAAATRRSSAARPCCSRAARPPCSTSTTAPTRSSRRRTRRAAAPSPARASRRTASTGSSAIVKAYTTRVGAGPVPDRAVRRVGRLPARARLRVRHHHGPPAPHRLVRRARSPATRRASTASPTSCSRSSTCSPASSASRSAVAYEVDGQRFDEVPVIAVRLPPRRCRSTRSSPAGSEDISGARDVRRPAARTRRPTCARSRAMSGSRISAIGVGPGRDQIVQLHDLLD